MRALVRASGALRRLSWCGQSVGATGRYAPSIKQDAPSRDDDITVNKSTAVMIARSAEGKTVDQLRLQLDAFRPAISGFS